MGFELVEAGLVKIVVFDLIGQVAKEDYMELRQEASELSEYSNAKLERVTRYLGVLAAKTRKLGKDEGCCSPYYFL